MHNVFVVPKELQRSIKSVSDNRQPGDQIMIDAKLFVALYGDDLSLWLAEDEAKQKALKAGAANQ